PLENYGIIGDNRTSVLISCDGSIGWACLPDFDSPSVFASILDPNAGYFKISPSTNFKSMNFYEPGTNILVTEFVTSTGKARLRSFMPYIPNRRVPTSEIHLYLEMISGTISWELIFCPRFDYGASIPKFEEQNYGCRAYIDSNHSITLSCINKIQVNEEKQFGFSNFETGRGEELSFVIDWGSHKVHSIQSYQSRRRLKQTRKFWREWISKLKYHGRYREQVERSLLAIKLLIYEPTGAIVAAPTTSIPEWIGGTRNWDYRYSWVRDSALILRALFKSGYIDEGTAYLDWIFQQFLPDENDSSLLLKVLYGIRGETEIPESTLNLRGYMDSTPVRIGNLAAEQFQLDIYGSLVDAAYLYNKEGGVITITEWEKLYRVIEFVRKRWGKPDSGIWEARNEPRHYTYSKVWAWVCLDRGIKLAKELGETEIINEWQKAADEIKEDVMINAYNGKIKAFTNYYGSDALDSSVLVMSKLGFIEGNDPRFISTIKVIADKLKAGEYPFLYRYLDDDGVGGEEGAFLLTSFWLAEAYITAGNKKEARSILESIIDKANPLGLYAEEVHPETGIMLGNFPQGFSHLGLINTALDLDM
ncbi:MAG: glycoside hydrolase family 15 protein, partial [Leptospiraceae bacterium]|nr:glycoside hydrolase family 15 protein [Leptospiraceae bacterium]